MHPFFYIFGVLIGGKYVTQDAAYHLHLLSPDQKIYTVTMVSPEPSSAVEHMILDSPIAVQASVIGGKYHSSIQEIIIEIEHITERGSLV